MTTFQIIPKYPTANPFVLQPLILDTFFLMGLNSPWQKKWLLPPGKIYALIPPVWDHEDKKSVRQTIG